MQMWFIKIFACDNQTSKTTIDIFSPKIFEKTKEMGNFLLNHKWQAFKETQKSEFIHSVKNINESKPLVPKHK